MQKDKRANLRSANKFVKPEFAAGAALICRAVLPSLAELQEQPEFPSQVSPV
jgi:hypothetical protein